MREILFIISCIGFIIITIYLEVWLFKVSMYHIEALKQAFLDKKQAKKALDEHLCLLKK